MTAVDVVEQVFCRGRFHLGSAVVRSWRKDAPHPISLLYGTELFSPVQYALIFSKTRSSIERK